jgi:hypothetical protein
MRLSEIDARRKFPAVIVKKIRPWTESLGGGGGFPSSLGGLGRDDSDVSLSAGKKQSSSRKRSPSFGAADDIDKSDVVSIFVRNR